MSSFLSHPCHGKCTSEPKDITDTIKYGFDPGLSLKPSERAAKRRRVERQAEIYISGGQLAIASAILRGPFSHGWVSPWQNHGYPEASLNDRERSYLQKASNGKKKRVHRKKPQEGVIYRKGDVRKSGQSSKRDSQKLANSDKPKNSVPKSKNASIKDKSRTNRGTKQRAPLGESETVTQEEGCNIGIKTKNSPHKIKGETSKNIWTNKDHSIAHHMLLAKTEDYAGNTRNDSKERKLASEATAVHNCQTPSIRKSMARKNLRPALSNDCMLQQNTVRKYMGSAQKAISRIQLEEDLHYSSTASDIDVSVNKSSSVKPVCNRSGSSEPENGGRDDVRFPDPTGRFALRRKGLKSPHRLDQIYSEPAGPENHIRPSSAAAAAAVGSRSSPIFKFTSANDVGEVRENPSTEEVASERSDFHRTGPRYMTFDSPAQHLLDESEAIEHFDSKIMHIHKNKNGSSSDHIKLRGETDEASLQAARPRGTSEERKEYKSAAEVPTRDSSYDHKSKSNVPEQGRSVVNLYRRISTNNSLNTDFSTQNALAAAQSAFQNEITRKEYSLLPSEEHELVDLNLQSDDHDKPVTPFANFRAKFHGSRSILQPTPQMSTQELIEMVSPLTFSSAAKSAAVNEACFASSLSKQRNGSEPSIAVTYHEDNLINKVARKSTQGSSNTPNIKHPLYPDDVKVRGSERSGSRGSAFSISVNGLLHEVPEHAQQYDPNIEVEAVLDDANSFLKSWDIESELKGITSGIKANGEKGKNMASFSKHV